MTGSVTLSMEIELAWGYHDLEERGKYDALSESRHKETQTLKNILTYCEKHEIPITFDIVGHLLLENCSGQHSGDYPDRWFSSDPGTNIETHPLFYAKDLTEMIERSKINHEICTHTFTHILGEESDRSSIDQDIQKAQNTHKKVLGRRSSSLVPPRHQKIDENILRNNGISIVRDIDGQIPSSKLETFVFFFYPNHPVKDIEYSDELVITYTSPVQSLTAPYIRSGQLEGNPIFQIIPMKARKFIHKTHIKDAINRAVDLDSHAHFWTHLHDAANQDQLDVVKQSIEIIDKKRDNDNFDILRMKDLH